MHANGDYSRIVAVGIAAGITAVAAGVGYGIHKGVQKLIRVSCGLKTGTMNASARFCIGGGGRFYVLPGYIDRITTI